jgi:hypothetical protein
MTLAHNKFLGIKISRFGWIAGITAASLCASVFIPDVRRMLPEEPRRLASGVKHNIINSFATNILGVHQQPHNSISVNGIPFKSNLNEESVLAYANRGPSFVLQLPNCSATAIAKTKDAVVVLATQHCPLGGDQVRTATGQRLGPVNKVFSTTSSQDLVLALIPAAPEVLSIITTVPVATPEEAGKILLQNTTDIIAVGYPQMNPFVARVLMNRTLGGDRHPVAIVAPLVEEGKGKNSFFVLNVGLLGSAAGFSGGALVGLSGNNPRIVGVITNQIRGERINGNQVINGQVLSTNTFSTTQTPFCVQGNEGENVSLSLEQVVKKIASLSPCGAR